MFRAAPAAGADVLASGHGESQRSGRTLSFVSLVTAKKNCTRLFFFFVVVVGIGVYLVDLQSVIFFWEKRVPEV